MGRKLPIKFRGREVETGEYIYAELKDIVGRAHREDVTFVLSYGLRRVKYDSLEQLCGYDRDGDEVYENDEVIDMEGRLFTNGQQKVYKAELWTFALLGSEDLVLARKVS